MAVDQNCHPNPTAANIQGTTCRFRNENPSIRQGFRTNRPTEVNPIQAMANLSIETYPRCGSWLTPTNSMLDPSVKLINPFPPDTLSLATASPEKPLNTKASLPPNP